MTSAASESSECRIEQSLGRSRTCVGTRCPFREQRSRADAGGCVFDELDLSGRHDLACWLHDLREQLEALGPADNDGRRLFFERLNAGQSD